MELTKIERDDLILAAETLLSIGDWETHVGNFINDHLLESQAEDMTKNLKSAVRKLKAAK